MMSEAHPDWWLTVNAIMVDHEERIAMLEATVGVEPETPPDEPHYDLRTYDQRTDARMDNHDVRIRALEHRLLQLEMRLKAALNAAAGADGV